MKKLQLSISLLAILLLISCRRNHQPLIHLASASPDIVLTGDNSQFSCVATDEDGDLLSYIWSCPNGNFPDGASDQSVTWTAPSEPGIYIITIIVSDGRLTDQDSFQITVNQKAINTAPTAVFEVLPESGTTETEFLFDASGSSDTETQSDLLLFRWDWTEDGDWDSSYSENNTETHLFSEPGIYAVKLEVKDEGGLTDTVSISVTVTLAIDDEGTFDYEGRSYAYKTIGTQTWMIENLAYLPSVNNPDDGSDSNPYHYVYDYEGTSVSSAKATDNYSDFGVLYNWEAALSACPSGWHLPSDEEWIILTSFLGADAGYKMKSGSGWYDNGNGDNSSEFNALPAGLRSYSGGTFDLGSFANFWSSSPNESSDAWYQYLGYNYLGVYRSASGRRRGFSVRCLRD